MLEKLLVYHCSPTLAGIKTGSLFVQKGDGQGELFGELRRVNGKLTPKGLRVVPLNVSADRVLVYAYRPAMLREDLRKSEAEDILAPRGYVTEDPGRCLYHLRERLQVPGTFPHEIGLFLGYPPEDVSGFINNGRCKCSGLWKVYGDEKAAGELFERYRKCTRTYCALLAGGAAIEALAVEEGRKADGAPESAAGGVETWERG